MPSEADPPRRDGLELSEDMAFQRRTWAIQRAGWLGMAAVVAATLLGLFSRGPLSHATVNDAGGRVVLVYERFLRAGAPAQLRIHCAPGGPERRLALVLGPELLDAYTIESLRPEPAASHSGEDGMTFEFAAPDGPVTVWLTIRPETAGLVRSRIGLAGQPPARFWQFIYP